MSRPSGLAFLWLWLEANHGFFSVALRPKPGIFKYKGFPREVQITVVSPSSYQVRPAVAVVGGAAISNLQSPIPNLCFPIRVGRLVHRRPADPLPRRQRGRRLQPDDRRGRHDSLLHVGREPQRDGDDRQPGQRRGVHHIVYDAYGKATVYDATWSNPAAPTEDGPLYCGYFFDAETGNDLARNRYYSVTLATWISRDPIESGPNLYEYCGDNPLIYTDPTGYCGCSGNNAGGNAPPARTDYECCEAAKKAGYGKGYIGITIVCDGRKVACALEDSATGVTYPMAVTMSRRCIRKHERTHFNDIDIDPKKCDLDWPDFKPGVDQATAECAAYTVHVDCLKTALRDCNGNQKCRDQIEKELKYRERAARDDWCKKAKKNPPKNP